MILHEFHRSIAVAPRLGHVAFLAPDARKGRHALLERCIRAGHPRAIALGLFPRPLLGQALDAFFAKRALDRLAHPDSELRVAVGEPAISLRRQPPEASRP